MMEHYSYFADFVGYEWPRPEEVAPYFLKPPGQRWFFHMLGDSGGFDLQGIDGTGHLPYGRGRIDIRLSLWGHPQLGVLVIWEKVGGGHSEAYTVKGDLTRLREWVRGMHGTPLPVGLFVPYETAWRATEDFLRGEGARSTRVDWIANRDLPPGTFPDP